MVVWTSLDVFYLYPKVEKQHIFRKHWFLLLIQDRIRYVENNLRWVSLSENTAESISENIAEEANTVLKQVRGSKRLVLRW